MHENPGVFSRTYVRQTRDIVGDYPQIIIESPDATEYLPERALTRLRRLQGVKFRPWTGEVGLQ